MYYKNYGINGDLEKYYKMPLNTDISLEENQRIIKLYRAYLLEDEKIMFECSGQVPKQKKKHTKIFKRYFDLRSILIGAGILIAAAVLFIMWLNDTSRTVLIVMALAFPFVYTTIVLIYWHFIDLSPDLEAIGKIKYLITDRRIIARHGEDVDITDINDILYVLPEQRGEKIGNVIFATNEPDFPVIFNGAYQHSGIYMTRDYSTVFEIIRTLLIDRDRRNEFISENSKGYGRINQAAEPIRKYQRTIVTDYGNGIQPKKIDTEMDELELPDQMTIDAMLGVDEDYKESEE